MFCIEGLCVDERVSSFESQTPLCYKGNINVASLSPSSDSFPNCLPQNLNQSYQGMLTTISSSNKTDTLVYISPAFFESCLLYNNSNTLHFEENAPFLTESPQTNTCQNQTVRIGCIVQGDTAVCQRMDTDMFLTCVFSFKVPWKTKACHLDPIIVWGITVGVLALFISGGVGFWIWRKHNHTKKYGGIEIPSSK
jgi:hypothetical protein